MDADRAGSRLERTASSKKGGGEDVALGWRRKASRRESVAVVVEE